MPIDRLIEITYTMLGRRNQQGIYEPGPTRRHRVWAQQKDIDLGHAVEEGGKRGERRRDWRIRWHEEIAGLPVSLLTVEDFSSMDNAGHFIEWSVINMVEVNGRNGETRRRWLDLQAVWSA